MNQEMYQELEKALNSYDESFLSYSMCVEEKKKQMDAIEQKFAKKQGALKDKMQEELQHKHDVVASLVDNLPQWYLDGFLFSTVMECMLEEEDNIFFYYEGTPVSDAVKRSFDSAFPSLCMEFDFFNWLTKSGEPLCVIPIIDPREADEDSLAVAAQNLQHYVSSVQKMLEDKGMSLEVFIPLYGDDVFDVISGVGVYGIYSPCPGKYMLGKNFRPEEYQCNNTISFNGNNDTYRDILGILQDIRTK